MKLALGLDLGTTSVSAVAVREDGSQAAAVSRPNRAAIPGNRPEDAFQDPGRHFEAAIAVLAELAATMDGSPCCLGMTGQMHGGMLIDQNRRPLTPLITWQDRGSTIAGPSGRSDLDAFLARAPVDAVAKTGCRPSAGYLGVTLFSLQNRPGDNSTTRLPVEARWAVTLADWVAAELSAGDPTTDRSNAASTGLYNLEDDVWSEPLLAVAGIEASLLPTVQPSGIVVGDLAPEIAARTGLPAGLPICNAVGDNQAAVLGSVPAGESALQINVGTGGQINWPVPRFRRVDGMDVRCLPCDRFMLVGAGTAGGAAYAWVKETLANWLSAFQFHDDPGGDFLYSRLSELAAAAPPDADGLVCEPFFRGTRRRPESRGSFGGISPRNFTPGHVARAVLNGIASALHDYLALAGDARPAEISRIIGSGNGLRQNRLLVESIARVFERDVWLPEHTEEAAYGTALLAGSQTEVWRNLNEAGTRIRLNRVATER